MLEATFNKKLQSGEITPLKNITYRKPNQPERYYTRFPLVFPEWADANGKYFYRCPHCKRIHDVSSRYLGDLYSGSRDGLRCHVTIAQIEEQED